MDSDWEHLKQSLAIGTKVRGIVTQHMPFGIFVRIEDIPFDGLVNIPDFNNKGRMTVEQYPLVGSTVEAVVLGFRDSNKQIGLGMRPSQLSSAEHRRH